MRRLLFVIAVLSVIFSLTVKADYIIMKNGRKYYSAKPLVYKAKGILLTLPNGKVLFIRNCYNDELAFPGGFIGKDEEEGIAARRELKEETGLDLSLNQLEFAGRTTFFHECKNEVTTLFTVTVDLMPSIEVNNREVVWAAFLSPTEALEQTLCPHTRHYLTNIASSVKK